MDEVGRGILGAGERLRSRRGDEYHPAAGEKGGKQKDECPEEACFWSGGQESPHKTGMDGSRTHHGLLKTRH